MSVIIPVVLSAYRLDVRQVENLAAEFYGISMDRGNESSKVLEIHFERESDGRQFKETLDDTFGVETTGGSSLNQITEENK